MSVTRKDMMISDSPFSVRAAPRERQTKTTKTQWSQIRNQLPRDRRRIALAAKIARQADAGLQRLAHRLLDALCNRLLPDVLQHHRRRTQQRDRIRPAL